MNKPRVIAFLARAGHGKTTAAKHVQETYGGEIVSFAGPLKRLALLMLPDHLQEKHLYGTTAEKEEILDELGISGGQFMQRLGEGARQEIDSLVWCRAAVNDILKRHAKNPAQDLFIVDDCRYVNESEFLMSHDKIMGHVIKLVCPDAVSTRDPNHPSEAQVDQVPPQFISQTIISKKSAESRDLKEKVDAAIQALFPTHVRSEHFKTESVSIP
jgi:hypothetical protein